MRLEEHKCKYVALAQAITLELRAPDWSLCVRMRRDLGRKAACKLTACMGEIVGIESV